MEGVIRPDLNLGKLKPLQNNKSNYST